MALFSRKAAPKKKVAVAKKEKATTTNVARDLSRVLRAPRITEKAMRRNEKNVYTFEIAPTATKFDVRDAVKQFFKVTPVKINIVNRTPRQFKSRARGRMALEHGIKKAYVHLKEGDSINLV